MDKNEKKILHLPPVGDKKWFWCVGEPDADFWYGPFDSRDKAIENAQSPEMAFEFDHHKTDVFHVVEAPYGGPEVTLNFDYYADLIIEKHDEETESEDGGETWSEQVGLNFEHRDDLGNRLQKAVAEWREAHGFAGSYHIHCGDSDFEKQTRNGGAA